MCLMGTQGSLKILAFALRLYPTLGVNNGDANTVCKGERAEVACLLHRLGCFDGLSAGRVMKSALLVFTPLSKGQFSQHNAHFQVIFNLA